MEMGKRIKERRISLGLTQEELGKELGLQKSAIAKYENGRVENIKRGIIAKMADVLKCSPIYLMGFSDDIETNTNISIKLSVHESKVISAYRKQSEIQLAVDLLLEDQECCHLVNKYARLDVLDKGRIYERIDVMLEDEKYASEKKALRNA